MAIDVVDIVTKGRHPLRGLTATLTAERAAEPPRRFVTRGAALRRDRRGAGRGAGARAAAVARQILFGVAIHAPGHPAGHDLRGSALTDRKPYLDAVRGIAVVIMVAAHVTDAWTRDADRHDTRFFVTVFVNGLGAPFFLLLAGVALAMAAESRARTIGRRRCRPVRPRQGLAGVRARVPLPAPGAAARLGPARQPAQGRHPQRDGRRDGGRRVDLAPRGHTRRAHCRVRARRRRCSRSSRRRCGTPQWVGWLPRSDRVVSAGRRPTGRRSRCSRGRASSLPARSRAS